jgi:hypothetical protein
VVLPASMWAMMPMLRTFVRSVSTSCATGFLRKVESGRGAVRAAPRRVRRPDGEEFYQR